MTDAFARRIYLSMSLIVAAFLVLLTSTLWSVRAIWLAQAGVIQRATRERVLAERMRYVALSLAAEGAAPEAVVDQTRIEQVLTNLIGNALKFTPADGRVEVRLTGADTGCGLAPEQLPHVFGRFWQSREARAKGCGLGLAITKAIVEAHGGRLGVESALGEGSIFTVALPR